jgi:hypothetical protein
MVWSKNFTHVMVTRFFLGVFEAAVSWCHISSR